MSDTENTPLLVGPDGKEIVKDPLEPISREQIALSIYRYSESIGEAPAVMNGFVQIFQDSMVEGEDGQLKISSSNPAFQDFWIGYGAHRVIDTALDEDLPKAYRLMIAFTDTPEGRQAYDEYQPVPEMTVEDIRRRFSLAPELAVAQEVCEIQGQITETLNGTTGKALTSFQANRIQERFEDVTYYLDFEQRAAGYYNLSILHRVLLGEKNVQDMQDNPDRTTEKECLKKVLEYSSDYKRIKYCANRLGSQSASISTIRAAYRRALTSTDAPNDLYKINLALAQTYMDKLPQKSSYSNSEQDGEHLIMAEHYLSEALTFAQLPEHMGILKNIAKLQFRQNNIEKWTETKTKIAMEFLQGEERAHTLIEVAKHNEKLRKPYLERAALETSKSRGIKKNKKAIILARIDHYLRPIYMQENDLEGLAKLDERIKKVAPKNKSLDNPLLKYKTKAR